MLARNPSLLFSFSNQFDGEFPIAGVNSAYYTGEFMYINFEIASSFQESCRLDSWAILVRVKRVQLVRCGGLNIFWFVPDIWSKHLDKVCSWAFFQTTRSPESFQQVEGARHQPPAGSQLTETRYAIIACLESASRCESATVVSSRSMGWVIPKPGKVGFESCRLVHGMCDFWKAWHRGLFLEWSFSGGNGQNFRRFVMDSKEHFGGEGAMASHLALAARCRHESISFVDESLDVANAFGALDRKTRKTRFNQDCERLTDFSSSHGDGDFSQKFWLHTE